MRPFISMKQEGFSIAPETRILAAADHMIWLEAEQLLQQARRRAGEVEKSARAAFREEKERGYREGLEAARQKETTQLIALSAGIIDYLDSLEHKVAETVTLALKKILGHFDERTLLFDVVRGALSNIRDQTRMVIRVSPMQVSHLREHVSNLIECSSGLEFLDIEADSRLDHLDCILETETGIIDAGLNTQLETIRKALSEALNTRITVAGEPVAAGAAS